VAVSLDRDNFKGGVLNSNFVVHVEGFAKDLVRAFPHPRPDIDVEQADDGNGIGTPSDNYLILVPSSSVLGQTAALKTLAQDAAGLKHDFESLYRILIYNRARFDSLDPCSNNPGNNHITSQDTERCFANNTVMLAVLDPRDVAMQANNLFPGLNVDVFPLNHAISFLPPSGQIEPGKASTARAVEQYQLYQQNQNQTQLVASLQSASSAATTASATVAAPVTTTTTTIKTPVPSSTKNTATNKTAAASTTTSISTTTSTTTTPSAPSAPGSTGQNTAVQSTPAAGAATPGQGAASAPVTGSATSGSPAGAATAPAQAIKAARAVQAKLPEQARGRLRR
jgi:hypothetical protein